MALTQVQQGMFGSGVAGNGPAFSAQMTSTQALSAGAQTVVQVGTVLYDTNSCYNTSTYKFTPNVAGYYHFDAVVRTNNGGSGEFAAMITKNSGNSIQGSEGATNSISINISVASGIWYLNGTTDYVQMSVYTSTACTLASGSSCLFSGFLARAA